LNKNRVRKFAHRKFWAFEVTLVASDQEIGNRTKRKSNNNYMFFTFLSWIWWIITVPIIFEVSMNKFIL
jgi:hypothetical protein